MFNSISAVLKFILLLSYLDRDSYCFVNKKLLLAPDDYIRMIYSIKVLQNFQHKKLT